MGTLARAIERKDWEAVALCLMIALVETARELPDATAEQLMDLLDSEMVPRAQCRAKGGLRRREARRGRRH